MAHWRRRPHTDFADEINAHLDLETDRLIAEGWSADAAAEAARRAFGNVAATKEQFFEASRWMWLEQLAQDLRYAWRGMLHSPAFVATTVLTLAIGLGLATAVFTVFNAYVLRPFAVRDPSALHRLLWRSQDEGSAQFRWRDYEELRDRRDLFDAVIAESTRGVSSNGVPLAAFLVSDNYFEALGVRFTQGRPFTRTSAGNAVNPVVLSDQAWSRLFGRDPAVLGHDLDLNGHRFVIIGVLAPEFTGLDEVPRDLWIPLTAYAAVAARNLLDPSQPPRIEITMRLRDGVSADRAQAALGAFMARIVEPGPQRRAVRAELRPQSSPITISLEILALFAPVFAAFGLVLVTACANVSNVMLARAIARHREIAVRLSLGASRARIIRQLLTEGLLIAALAGIAGIVLAAGVLRAATAIVFRTLPASATTIVRLAPLELDHRVLLFVLGVAAATTMLFALVPAWQGSRLTLTDALHGLGGSAHRGSRLRGALVAGQVAVSLVLVITALTLARNGAAVGAIDLGFETRGVVSVNVRGQETTLIPKLAAVLASDPRIGTFAVTDGNPLFGRRKLIAAVPAGARNTVAATGTRYTFVSPEYFPLLRIPILRGRTFRQDESRSAGRVAIVSAATAAAFWPGENPIGQTIRIERAGGRPVDELPGYAEVTVVGTASDVVSGLMVDGTDAGHIYLPASAADTHAGALLLRASSDRGLDPGALPQMFQRTGADPESFEALPLDEVRALQMYPLLAASWIGTLLAGVALALSVSGLYGVLTYTLTQRTKEIGIRMALGATEGAVLRLVFRQVARLAGWGAAFGLIVALGVLGLLSAAIRLRNVSVLDAGAFAASLLVVVIATALAAYQPARRATRVDPSETLRAEG